MTIHYKIGSDGSFTAGESETGFTCYAYPTSEHAVSAKRNPEKVAREMMSREMAFLRTSDSGKQYDARNWERIRS